MQPDVVQEQDKPLECRAILLGALKLKQVKSQLEPAWQGHKDCLYGLVVGSIYSVIPLNPEFWPGSNTPYLGYQRLLLNTQYPTRDVQCPLRSTFFIHPMDIPC